MPGKAREVGDVGGVVGGQTLLAHPLRKTQAPEVFHRARLRGVGLRVKGGGRPVVHQQAAHTAPAQFYGQHQAAGAAAGDEDVGGEGGCHSHRPGC